jgi:NADPH:quinone reductase-like Zn-dependent oxidoreductase
LRSLGAHEVIDADSIAFESVVKDVDVVLDTLGGEFEQRALSVLKPGGLLTAIVKPLSQAAAAERQVRAVLVSTRSQTAVLAELSRRIDMGELRHFVGRTYMLNQAARAWQDYTAKQVDGKIVIQVAPL